MMTSESANQVPNDTDKSLQHQTKSNDNIMALIGSFIHYIKIPSHIDSDNLTDAKQSLRDLISLANTCKAANNAIKLYWAHSTQQNKRDLDMVQAISPDDYGPDIGEIRDLLAYQRLCFVKITVNMRQLEKCEMEYDDLIEILEDSSSFDTLKYLEIGEGADQYGIFRALWPTMAELTKENNNNSNNNVKSQDIIMSDHDNEHNVPVFPQLEFYAYGGRVSQLHLNFIMERFCNLKVFDCKRFDMTCSVEKFIQATPNLEICNFRDKRIDPTMNLINHFNMKKFKAICYELAPSYFFMEPSNSFQDYSKFNNDPIKLGTAGEMSTVMVFTARDGITPQILRKMPVTWRP